MIDMELYSSERKGRSRRFTVRAPERATNEVELDSVSRKPKGNAERFRQAAEPRNRAKKLPWPVILFLTGIVIPWVIPIGPLRMTIYRIVLVTTIVPCLFMWMSGRAGRVRFPDFVLLLFCAWGILSLAMVHGIETAIQSGGILFVETMGAYLLARCYIRNENDFYNMARLLFIIIVFLLPFGLVETVTGYKPLLAAFGAILPTTDITMMEPRRGLWRVQGPFDHPILFGVSCGSMLAMTHLVLGYGKSPAQRWLKSGLVVATTCLSLSSGPLSALMAQILLLSWNGMLRRIEARWKIFWGLLAVMYAFISVASNQSVPAFYITHAPLFDVWSAYYRLLQWDYGSASVVAHPFFGIGFHEYERPDWMVASIDMFWLFNAITYGAPAGILIFVAFLSLSWAIGLKKGLDERLKEYRTAYLLSMLGFFLAGWAVHFWNSSYVLFVFLIGSGAWFLDVKKETTKEIRRAKGLRQVRRPTIHTAQRPLENA
ncbi:O-antigen ligase family protein [Microvirga alba]|uniref:O-antigen ligase domain-containing protein n=1 Tax=Microvirga alba TaxID=2791025 RepID=A0A931BKS1_9HYPH|nr:hypothetical protein [Microvirga alba]MBF9232812.1 hypothetical protein [Microvirga alba]